MSETKTDYEKLKKKYNLPDFDLLNRDFEIADIESDLLLNKIAAKIHDKIESYAKLMEAVLQPDSNLMNLYEVHYVKEEQRNKAYTLFKRLVMIIRKYYLANVENNEKEIAGFIKESFDEWQTLKKGVRKHVESLVDIWKKETDIKDDISYLG